MIKKIIVIWGCAALIFILIGLKVREYQRAFRFEKSLLQRMDAIEKKQDEILARLNNGKAREGFFGEKFKAAQKPRAPEPPVKDETVYTIDIGATPVRGDINGRVTIVEFSDFQCPFSQRFHPLIAQVLEAYPQGVKYVFKSFPLPYHPQARPATKALWAAHEQGKYWEMLDALFVNANMLSEEKYREVASQIGLDVDRFTKDLKDKDAQWEKIILDDMNLAQQVNFMGTPTFYINGKKTDARTLEALKREIDLLLK